MRENFVRHHNHNQFILAGWAGGNGRPEPSQDDNDVSDMQWMVKEVIHNNANEFLVTTLQSGIIIRAVSDGS